MSNCEFHPQKKGMKKIVVTSLATQKRTKINVCRSCYKKAAVAMFEKESA